MKTAIVLIAAMLAQASGDVLLSRGMKQADHFFLAQSGSWPKTAWQIASLPEVWVGTILLILFFALFAAALSWADLSFVLPITSFGYILNVAFAAVFLGEKISSAKWAGSLLIVLGVLAVARSEAHQKRERHASREDFS
jgi:drug/metabolite transporter (DMT)-like permease